MIERQVDIRTASGTMETFITHPVEDGPFPPVILYMDVWGLREELFDIARRIGTVGYCVAVPDLYHRQGRVRNEFRDASDRMITLARLTPEQQEQVRTPLRKLTDARVMEDTRDLLAHADAALRVAGAVGVIGYCMGGRHALLAAGLYSDRIAAAASLHGTSLVKEGDDSPHRVAARSRGELYCGFGERDPEGAPRVVQTLAGTFSVVGIEYRYQVHPGAEHGYALPDRDIYDKQASNRDWEIIFAMFRRRLR